MRSSTCALIMGVVAMALCAPRTEAADAVGKVELIEGAALAAGQGGDRQLAVGDDLHLGERVRTGAGSKIQIRFSDGTSIAQGESSELVIAEYLFSPAAKEDNRMITRMTKGLFRVITDQIARLNPEEFKVKTNYGTIGIRGCELIFKVLDDFEEVFIVRLHELNSVVLTVDETGEEKFLAQGAKGSMVVTEKGVAVSISRVQGLKERHYTADEIAELNRLTTPEAQGARSTRDQFDDSDFFNAADRLIADLALQSAVAASEADKSPEQASAPPAVTTDDEPGSGIPDPIRGPRRTLASGSGQDWGWDVWARDITRFDSGEPVTTTDYGVRSGGNGISGSDFQAIADGATLYNLSGQGAAGALLTMGSEGRAVSGSADLNVRVGAGITPAWSGDFNMGNGSGDSLSFNADGSIEGGNLKKGSLNSYSLNAFGGSYGQGSLSREDIGGEVVGSGQGPDPISGAIVEFDFEHGGGPRAKGAGGADF